MNDDMYQMDKADYDTINETADWFLGTLRPRTSSEVRGMLVKLYLKGMSRGIRLSAKMIEDM